ncbi:hypothetical protein [Actimicrobium sp. CCI2.3]|uniref:hypothetical protein n=1 Tax=Actimicrobium sp. CCI2.3 TaxID=3048616 RepID=UPI002AB342CC|nr:hypothetical protein [Actimicrobium sp. CCI2.3]MDY7574381.1 hypothetical protein [Actimicrobium sp. CCI2.3]MEB0022540.1 hypothetical protein [Actimicrobium sp. CCI2.3]
MMKEGAGLWDQVLGTTVAKFSTLPSVEPSLWSSLSFGSTESLTIELIEMPSANGAFFIGRVVLISVPAALFGAVAFSASWFIRRLIPFASYRVAYAIRLTRKERDDVDVVVKHPLK